MNSSRYHDGGGGQLVNSFRNHNGEGTGTEQGRNRDGTGTEQGRNRDGTGTPTKTFFCSSSGTFKLQRGQIHEIVV